MKKRILVVCVLICTTLLLPAVTYQLKDGTFIQGTLLEETPLYVTLRTPISTITIERSSIQDAAVSPGTAVQLYSSTDWNSTFSIRPIETFQDAKDGKITFGIDSFYKIPGNFAVATYLQASLAPEAIYGKVFGGLQYGFSNSPLEGFSVGMKVGIDTRRPYGGEVDYANPGIIFSADWQKIYSSGLSLGLFTESASYLHGTEDFVVSFGVRVGYSTRAAIFFD